MRNCERKRGCSEEPLSSWRFGLFAVSRVDRICFPGRCKAVRGGCGQNFVFCTPRKNIDPLEVRTASADTRDCALVRAAKKRGP
jgi:hypothetical protein